jgi:arylsulfatase A-like enzyme
VRRELAFQREEESEALLSVDDAVRRLMAEVAARGDLGRTIVFFLTDNGYSFGAHRWIGKQCPYEECICTPFAVRIPWVASRTVSGGVVSNVDLAPTIADFAGVTPALAVDGTDLRPVIDPPSGTPPHALPRAAFIEYLGGEGGPNWIGVRTERFTYVEYPDGERELYDLAGTLGPADPGELDNRARDPTYARIQDRLASLVQSLR